MVRATWALAALLCLTFSASRGQVNLSNGLVAYYPFGGNANDASGNGNNPTTVNATLTTGAAGVPNTAYLFNGAGNYISVPNSTSLSLSGPMTMYAYVRVDGFYYGACHGNVVFHKGDGDYIPGNYGIRFDDNLYTNGQNCASPAVDTTHQLFYGIVNPNTAPPTAYTPYIQKGQWFCVIAVQDSFNLKFYVNGNLVGTKPNPISGLGTNTANLHIGRLGNPAVILAYPYWFKGAIDEIRIYNRAINAQEINALCAVPIAMADTIINAYGAVQAYDSCTNALTLDDAQPFNAGDTVLMIQMKGALVDSSNTAAFGNILQTGNAGNYEFNIVQSRTGNVVRLQNAIQRTYSIPSGKVQLVRVPHYGSYTISILHTAPAWNGAKGGVFVVSVAGQLSLNANIDVSGKGFRGGVQVAVPPSIQNCGLTTWSGPVAINLTAEKGEGIAEVSASKMGGRGKLANGGGAGNVHNAGGGGGSNAGAGGLGGSEFNGCNPNPSPSVTQGIGGVAMIYSNPLNKVFMGGGGGAGEVNNYTQSSGGAGGGIIIIRAGSISSPNNGQLVAGGLAAPECTASGPNNICHDGMGGGGGGGAILVSASNVIGTLLTKTLGGNGGNMSAAASYGQVGPGGGGGGGTFWFSGASIPSTVNAQNGPGLNGVISYNGSPWGASAGTGGSSLTGLVLPVANVPFVVAPPVTIQDSILTCRTILFTATGGGAGTPTWNFGNGITATGNPVTYTYPAGGTFIASVQYPNCGGSDTETVVLPSDPTVAISGANNFCAGASTALTASGAATYVWSPATGLNNTTGSGVVASPTAATTYTATGTAATGCTGTATINVVVNPTPAVTGTASPTVICQGNSSTLSANSPVLASYTWNPGTLPSAVTTVSPTATTTYTVTATTAAGCSATDTALVTVLPKPVVFITTTDATVCPQSTTTLTASAGATAGTLVWGAPASGTTASITTPPITAPTTFSVFFTAANGCRDTATQSIGLHPQPIVVINGPSLLCSGTGPASLSAAGAVNYAWSPAQYLNATSGATVQSLPPVGTSITYTATGTDANGCTGTDQHTLLVQQSPVVNAGPDTAVCSGNALTLFATGAASIAWNPTNSTAAGDSIKILETVIANTTYTYVATGTAGACSDADTVMLTVRALPAVLTLPKTAYICRYDSARLMATGAAMYAWSPVIGLANPAFGVTMAKPESATTYTVTGTDAFGCVNRDTARVNVNEALPVKASGDGQPISCDNSLAQLHATGAATYVWSPGRYLNDSTMAHPVATPPSTMQFTVIGSNSAGCTGRDTITVVSLRESTLMMPNVFTPNGDGLNDRVYPLVYCDFTFRSFGIYNRWGQQVFLSTKPEQGWDGRFQGEPADVGVYMFMLQGTGDSGQAKTLTGNITLLR